MKCNAMRHRQQAQELHRASEPAMGAPQFAGAQAGPSRAHPSALGRRKRRKMANSKSAKNPVPFALSIITIFWLPNFNSLPLRCEAAAGQHASLARLSTATAAPKCTHAQATEASRRQDQESSGQQVSASEWAPQVQFAASNGSLAQAKQRRRRRRRQQRKPTSAEPSLSPTPPASRRLSGSRNRANSAADSTNQAQWVQANKMQAGGWAPLRHWSSNDGAAAASQPQAPPASAANKPTTTTAGGQSLASQLQMGPSESAGGRWIWVAERDGGPSGWAARDQMPPPPPFDQLGAGSALSPRLQLAPPSSAAATALTKQPELARSSNRDSAFLSNWLLNQLAVPTAPSSAGARQREPVGQDSSAMVSYSPIANSLAGPAQSLQQQSSVANLEGLSVEQLAAALQLLAANEQQQQQLQPSVLELQQARPEPAMVSMFESMFKTLIQTAGNSASTNQQASGQLAAQATHSTQAPATQQQQQQASSATTTSAPQPPEQAAKQSMISQQPSFARPSLEQQQASGLHQQLNRPPLLQSSSSSPLHDPYAEFRPMVRRRKRKKGGTGKGNDVPQLLAGPFQSAANSNPLVRVQKKARQRGGGGGGGQRGQKFREHNASTDLQPAATLHKLKHPWLYQDDEEEEDGETEINLRFFNNFSRMGPFGGVGRVVGPASMFASIGFLILSNISLAATIIVHGIAALLRNMSQANSGLPDSSPLVGHHGPKSFHRLGRILHSIPIDSEASTSRSGTPKGLPSPPSSLPKSGRNGTGENERIRKRSLLDFDLLVESFANSWEASKRKLEKTTRCIQGENFGQKANRNEQKCARRRKQQTQLLGE